MRPHIRVPVILFIAMFTMLLILPAEVLAHGRRQRRPAVSVAWVNRQGEPVNEIKDTRNLFLRLQAKQVHGKLVMRYRLSEDYPWQSPRPRQQKWCQKWQKCYRWRGKEILVPANSLSVGKANAQIQFKYRHRKVTTLSKSVSVLPNQPPCANKSDGICWHLPFTGDHPITSYFGSRWNGFHDGIDYGMPCGTPVRPIAAGKVINVGKNGVIMGNQSSPATPANFVIIQHSPTWISRYWHLNRVDVQIGQEVQATTRLGLSGNTGYVRGSDSLPLQYQGCHLHLELHRYDEAIDPGLILY